MVRFAATVATVVLVGLGLLEAWTVLGFAVQHPNETLGMDLRLYVEHAQRWMEGGGFYMSEQMQPYVVQDLDPLPPLYPPVILYLLVPIVWGVPWPVWWLVPAAIIAAALVARRPVWWQWPLLAAILVYPRTWTVLVYGNPAMWALAFLAAGMVWTWPAPFTALKLTFAPLGLIGIRRRRWWRGAAAGLLLAIPFGAMWFDFGRALLNASSRGIEYVIGEWPIAVLLGAGLVLPRRQGYGREGIARERRGGAPEGDGTDAPGVLHRDGVEVIGR